eukprot:tig00020802_g13995.t1
MRSVASFDALDDAVLGGVLARLGPPARGARAGHSPRRRGASLELELARRLRKTPMPRTLRALGRLAVAAALACWEAAAGCARSASPGACRLPRPRRRHAGARRRAAGGAPPSGALESLALTVDGCGAGDPRGRRRGGARAAFHVDAAAVARCAASRPRAPSPSRGPPAARRETPPLRPCPASAASRCPRTPPPGHPRRPPTYSPPPFQVGLANQYALEGLYPLPLESLSAGPLLAPDEPFVRLAASPAGRSLRTLRLWRSDGGAVLLPRRALSHLSRLPSLTAFDFCASLELADSPGAAAAARALAGALRRCTPLTDLELRFEFLEPRGVRGYPVGAPGGRGAAAEAGAPRAAGTARGGGRGAAAAGGRRGAALAAALEADGSGAQRDARL